MKKLILIFLLLVGCNAETPNPVSNQEPVIEVIQNNYSLEEVALRNPDGTPLRWIDGKPIYRKSGSGTVQGVATPHKVLVCATEVENMVSGFLLLDNIYVDVKVEAWYAAKNLNYGVSGFILRNNNIEVEKSATDTNSYTFYYTVEYTKSTDEAIPN